MAGDWIKMRSDLHTHPKVVRISSALRADRLRTVGGLHAVWCLFDAHSEDGSLDGYTLEVIDDHIGWPGFASAMQAVGWIETHGECVRLPGFDEHNGRSAKRRAMETQRKRMEREGATDDRNVSASYADKKRTREEKRREDISTSEDVERGADASRGSRLPKDFALPDDWIAFCESERPDLNPYEVGKTFTDYWHGVAGAKGRRADWLATWRNWVRKESAPRNKQAAPGKAPESFRERDERIARERVNGLIYGSSDGPEVTDFANVIDITPTQRRIAP